MKAKKLLLLNVLALGLVGLAACNNSSKSSAGDDEEEDAGFSEVEIFSNKKMAFLNVNAVYFQAVSMTGGYSNPSLYDCHLELDVSAGENDYGYGVGDWVPYLTVEYEVSQAGWEGTSGTFMPMAASDGPHYGQNIKMNGDGRYTVKFTITFPTEAVYLIHTDETGPEESVFPDPVSLTYDAWDYVDGAWLE